MSGEKCNINWELVCKLKIFGGLGVLNLKKFATALHLCWLWFEWVDTPKTSAGMETPCNESDKYFFSAFTIVNIGDGKKAKLWDSSWLNGLQPNGVAPEIDKISKKKACLVSKALDNNFWIKADRH